MIEDTLRYELANNLVFRIKQLIIVLYNITNDTLIDNALMESIAGKSGYILEFNEKLLSPHVEVSAEILTSLVLSQKHNEYLAIKLKEDFDESTFLNVANYSYRGLSRGLSEWWAPSDMSQKKKDEAVDDVFKAAKKYLEHT